MQLALGNVEGTSCAAAMREAASATASAGVSRSGDANDRAANGNATPGSASLATQSGAPRWSGSTKSKQVEWEHIAQIDPDVIIVSGCGLDLERNRVDSVPVFRSHPVASQLRAVKEGRVFAMDGNRTLSRPGPCLVEGAAAVAACVWHGDAARIAAIQATECLPAEGIVWGKLEV
jgi:ABC-type Fe3+-hydroxamate transport system substrate-binding protein